MSNEEKILEMLTALNSKVDRQGEQLSKQGEQLSKQGEQLAYLTARVDEIDARSLRSAVLLETEVAKKVQLLYEGQALLKEKMDELAPKERVEVLADEVAALKVSMKMMVKRLEALEKAQ